MKQQTKKWMLGSLMLGGACLWLGVAAGVAPFASAEPASAEPAANIESVLTLGDHVYGPKITKDDLAGRVVLIEDWGIR